MRRIIFKPPPFSLTNLIGFFGGVKQSKIITAYSCLEFACYLMKTNACISRGVICLLGAISRVNGAGYVTKVANSIINFVSIHVINFADWIVSIIHFEDNSTCDVLDAFNFPGKISLVTESVTGYFSSKIRIEQIACMFSTSTLSGDKVRRNTRFPHQSAKFGVTDEILV